MYKKPTQKKLFSFSLKKKKILQIYFKYNLPALLLYLIDNPDELKIPLNIYHKIY